ncbi:Nicotinate-nucleotide-dimethylbenzimidazole phosphoribosyltransferase [Shewanella piezotolerans WP3]|uniref:Nicotinate-nucleotide--dimethylbenzimidazole phosphoribosyltransferase n=1 Tax=Shewanella piezotolerans (strain WP3 / JCM 13877) TaxID=225849 RepID=COBT_SHEPW|nr:nicotinate-nucleotide--dimethylbenzimidazole phosphoribosyltransferase [Shewanella piezotolerans]B8CJ37.1 RecName: Full=Nicotinate-nucleotide--dimethylbenzimidazole phosphoribosyltransferase; Short=NN:DBI PRT; AltName: Full=N(1)-alpha-phosphoribosyltransferase [Shewanella piezotolerans WP3]ACJ27799.1 Nicotinate-nucleotide-dimethylbenzimidazole phosphoribosyltransferase [Shewanella piezotolerans WP3]
MFNIKPLSSEFEEAIQQKIDTKTKPLGALGDLEGLALQIAKVLGKDNPQINNPKMMVFAADHGIASSGVSIAPSEVTAQMVRNFMAGGAAINVFTRQVGLELEVIDCGVLQPFDSDSGVIDQRLGAGTGPIHKRAAMTLGAVKQGFEMAADRIQLHHQNGCNLIALGEMGIGNTSSAAAIMSVLTGVAASDCVGRGTGIDAATFKRKQMLIEQAVLLHHSELDDPMQVLACIGGFEIVQMTGAILAAAERGMLVVIDGFIASAAALVAVNINSHCRDYMIFSHQSDEKGHYLMLEYMQAKPLLNLGLKLGEGTGAALAFPLIQAAVNFYNQMASFEDAGIEI